MLFPQTILKSHVYSKEVTIIYLFVCLFILGFYLCLERGRKRERETLVCKGNTDWLPFTCPQPGTWSATQACALTRKQTVDPSVCGMMHNPLSHTSQDIKYNLISSFKVH